jgi:hypothetical protein
MCAHFAGLLLLLASAAGAAGDDTTTCVGAQQRGTATLLGACPRPPTSCGGPQSLLFRAAGRYWARPDRPGRRVCVCARARRALAGSRPQILLFGDSITQHAAGRYGWATELAEVYSRKADVINRGFSGYNSAVAWRGLSTLCACHVCCCCGQVMLRCAMAAGRC